MRKSLPLLCLSLIALPACSIINPPPGVPYDCAAPPAFKGLVKVKDQVPGYIVVLKKIPTALSTTDLTAVASQFAGLTEVKTFQSFGMFSATMTEASALKVSKDARVAYVQQNRKVKINERPASWGLDRVDQRDLPLDWTDFDAGGATGKDVHAYGLDTGIDCKNADFAGKIGESFSAVAGVAACVDGHGHGTHTAGTFAGTKYGVAKAAIVHSVTVLDAQGSGSDEGVIAGIDWVTQHVKANGWRAVANMSLGGPAPAPALDQAVCNAIAAGVAFGIAAGNDGSDACGSAPANVLQALTLGATDKTDAEATFSNDGAACTDLFAPGVDVESDMPGGGGAVMSGTSMAAPHGTGTLALCFERTSTATVAECNAAVIAAASKDKLSGVKGPNLLLCVKP